MTEISLDPEKTPNIGKNEIHDNIHGVREGYTIDASTVDGSAAELKTTANGKIILIPQPSDDNNDPLNWSTTKKHLLLAIVSFISFLPDFGASVGIPAFLPQAKYWHITPDFVQRSFVGSLFTLGAGGLFFVAFAAYFGRLPVLLVFQTLALATGIWSGATTNFNSYAVARTLNGFFATSALSGGLLWINDMFFFHDRPRKINIWSGCLIASPYVGPMVSSFIISKTTWRWNFWILTILNAIGWFLIVLSMDETMYTRNIRARSNLGSPSRSRWLRLLGVEQWRSRRSRESASTSMLRPILTFFKLPVATLVIYYLLNFAWVIGVNATISIWLSEYYHFTPASTGLFYIGGIAGALIGWAIGHYLHDLLGRLYISRHAGHITPEARLTVLYLAAIPLIASPIIIGNSLARHWHYMVLGVFFATQIVGIMVATVGVEAYVLDAYPEASGDVSAWVNMGRAMGGFMATYVQIEWVERMGPVGVFGVEAGVSAASLVLVAGLQWYGGRLRAWQGPVT